MNAPLESSVAELVRVRRETDISNWKCHHFRYSSRVMNAPLVTYRVARTPGFPFGPTPATHYINSTNLILRAGIPGSGYLQEVDEPDLRGEGILPIFE